MKLIYRVIKKVDKIEEKIGTLEEKLDRIILREKREELKRNKFAPKKKQEIHVYEDVDPGFIFTPIENDEELDHVTQRINGDRRYKRNLVSFNAFRRFFL